MKKSKKRMTPTRPHPVLFLDEHFQIRTNRNKGELLSRGILYVGRSFTIMKGYLSPSAFTHSRIGGVSFLHRNRYRILEFWLWPGVDRSHHVYRSKREGEGCWSGVLSMKTIGGAVKGTCSPAMMMMVLTIALASGKSGRVRDQGQSKRPFVEGLSWCLMDAPPSPLPRKDPQFFDSYSSPSSYPIFPPHPILCTCYVLPASRATITCPHPWGGHSWWNNLLSIRIKSMDAELGARQLSPDKLFHNTLTVPWLELAVEQSSSPSKARFQNQEIIINSPPEDMFLEKEAKECLGGGNCAIPFACLQVIRQILLEKEGDN
ncbi:hypothetical protein HNY73_022806 [Argiope bruennichi]|uniref:Uncharacterized protein n=1 Tax=Argiope bruennichi TaxID=94029 RepID=A0A8T0E5Q4_ARGBR|nr:hypothetical protein HNY73_022806 [Argiope bruennichi]